MGVFLIYQGSLFIQLKVRSDDEMEVYVCWRSSEANLRLSASLGTRELLVLFGLLGFQVLLGFIWILFGCYLGLCLSLLHKELIIIHVGLETNTCWSVVNLTCRRPLVISRLLHNYMLISVTLIKLLRESTGNYPGSYCFLNSEDWFNGGSEHVRINISRGETYLRFWDCLKG